MSWLSNLFGKKDAQASTSTANMKKISENTYELRISGVLSKTTVDNVQKIGARDIEKGTTSLQLLVIVTDFRGWRLGDNWGDIDFFAKYGNRITRIAVVGDLRWEAETMMFLGATQRKGEVRFFPPQDEAKARGWLAEGL